MDTDAAQDWESPPEPATVETPDTSGQQAEGIASQEPAETTEQPPEGEAPQEELSIEDQKKKLEDERKEINRIGFEVRQLRKQLKDQADAKATPADIELTDSQFEALMTEHGDDPRMRVQLMKQMAKQIAKGEKLDAVKTVERQRVIGIQNQFLSQNFPDLAKDDSPMRTEVEQAKGILDISDRPDADFLATAAVIMARVPQMIKDAEERGKSLALKGKGEKARVAAIKGAQAPTATTTTATDKSDASNNFGLTAQQMETAKKNFGFTRPEQFKWYAQNLKATAGGARA